MSLTWSCLTNYTAKPVFVFLYSSDQLENLSRIDVVADRKKMREVLEDALKETSLTCVFEEDMVMLRERQQQQVSELVVKGLVTDTKKQPLPGVTVMIKGTSLGTVTDAEGHYVLTIPQRDELVLVFSFVGMNSREVTYKGEKELNVELEEKDRRDGRGGSDRNFSEVTG